MKTTISIEETTRDRLADLGKKRETYDTIINQLIDEHDRNASDK